MENPDLEFQRLLRRIAEQDDQKAFSIFFDRYHTKLLRYALFFVGSMEEAEDVVSDVLIKMLKRRREAFLKENFIGYLFQSVKNACLDYLKNVKRKSLLSETAYNERDYFAFESQTPLSQIMLSEFTRLLCDLIEALPPKRRMVFQLIKDEEMSYRQVAELMDISERTVEVHLRLALQDIRNGLDVYLDQGKAGTEGKDISGLIALFLLIPSTWI